MKPAGLFAMTYLSVTQLKTRRRLVEAELERERAKASARRAVERPRRARRLLRAVRGAA